MSGPRVTTGDAGLQDGSTPPEFMKAVERRFGPVAFDLAAHRLNKKHPRYLAPPKLTFTFDPKKHFAQDVAQVLRDRGALLATYEAVRHATQYAQEKVKLSFLNSDPDAAGMDAFQYSWTGLSANHPDTRTGGPGILWLNPEWADMDPWAEKSAREGAYGANILLLSHVAVTDWFTRHIAGRADVYLLKGRLSFDGGKNVLPKDCMLSHFWPGQRGRLCIWDWRRDEIRPDWGLAPRGA